jgi:broad specificity phosphatase PhoE
MPTFKDFVQGISDALAHVRSQCEGNVLVVSSGGPISTAVGTLLGTPPESMIEMNMRIRNTAVSECVYNPKRTTLVSFNTINHLDADAYRDWVTFT